MNLLVFGSCEHSRNSDEMQILDLQSFRTVSEEGVHEIDTAEKGLFTHLIGRQHFDHPVNHFGAKT